MPGIPRKLLGFPGSSMQMAGASDAQVSSMPTRRSVKASDKLVTQLMAPLMPKTE